MTKVRLPDGHDIGILKLHQDGAIEMPDGTTVVDCDITDMKFGNCDVDIKPTDGGTSLDIRCHDGDRFRLIHDGSYWYALDPNDPVDKGSPQRSGADETQSKSLGAAGWLSAAALVAVFVLTALIIGS